MGPPEQKDDSVVGRFRRFVDRRLGLVVIAGMVLTALVTFFTGLDKLVELGGKYLRPGATSTHSGTSPIPSPTRGTGSGQTGGGTFAGLQWGYTRERGDVEIREEELELFTHKAEALAWIEGPERREFRFSCAVKLISGSQSLGFGPVFWLRDERNFLHFAVRTAGDYRLVRYRDGQPEELIRWTPNQNLKRVQVRQTLEVRAKGNGIDLLVDGSLLTHYDFPADQVQAGRLGVFAPMGGLTVNITQVQVTP